MEKNELLRSQDFYKKKIIEIVNKINRTDILNYIYIVVSDIMRERRDKGNV